MIEKKLVEKEVEVTVTEKRVVELFTYEGVEYTKDDLAERLMCEAMNDCDEHLSKTHWRTHPLPKDIYRQLYKILHAKMILIESLDDEETTATLEKQ